MASRNSDSVVDKSTGGSGEFHASKPRDEPQEKHGHQPGKLTGNDAVPEFHAQTLPPGTAPSQHTYKPNNAADIDTDAAQSLPTASDTVQGATSADVHTGLGHPGSGQSSSELRGNVDRKVGLEGRGATVSSHDAVDARDPKFADQRALDKDDAKLQNALGGAGAHEKQPDSA